MLKILFIASTDGFCSYYRMKYPYESLKKQKLADVKYIQYGDLKSMQEGVNWADVIHLQVVFPSKPIESLLSALKTGDYKKIVGCDFDDNLFKTDPLNPCYSAYGTQNVTVEKDGVKHDLWKDGLNINLKENKEKMDYLKNMVGQMDFVTCTNKYLQKELKKYNKNTYVIPNYLYFDLMPDNKRKKDSKIIIGWHGGNSHYSDIARIIPILGKLKKEYGNRIGFRMFGARFDALWNQIGAECVPWISPRLFFDRFSAKRYDIAIIPLEDTEFNRSKSNIKWLENSYYDIPCVVENVSPYKEHLKNNVNCFSYRKEKELLSGLRQLIDDKILRLKISQNAREYTIKNFDIDKKIKERLSLYEKLYNKK